MHYHIRWSDSKLDWKPFSTREETEQAARRLARRGEAFTVEHADDKTCMQSICKRMVRKEMDGQSAGMTSAMPSSKV